ncbi:MAG: hypothetical protein JSS66_05060 [Armatimonadetes bacterium]|nr:hypothetical protein [Armatimonadota bacterium]
MGENVVRTDVENYLEVAAALDAAGLFAAADDVTSLAQVRTAMSYGEPLFASTSEHEEYLRLVRAASVAIQRFYKPTDAADAKFVQGELDKLNRRAQLWQLMLAEETNVRLAQTSGGPVWNNVQPQSAAELSPQVLDKLRPMLVHLWENGIRMALAADGGIVTTDALTRSWNQEARALGPRLQSLMSDENHKGAFRKLGLKDSLSLVKAKHALSVRDHEDQSVIKRWWAAGLAQLQNEMVHRTAELLAAKILEPDMAKTKSQAGKTALASAAAGVLAWFFQPRTVTTANMDEIAEMAESLGMPQDQILPKDFFDHVAGDTESDGLRFFDDAEVSDLEAKLSDKPGASILAAIQQAEPAESNDVPEETTPADEAPIEPAEAVVPPVKPKRIRKPTKPMPEPAMHDNLDTDTVNSDESTITTPNSESTTVEDPSGTDVAVSDPFAGVETPEGNPFAEGEDEPTQTHSAALAFVDRFRNALESVYMQAPETPAEAAALPPAASGKNPISKEEILEALSRLLQLTDAASIQQWVLAMYAPIFDEPEVPESLPVFEDMNDEDWLQLKDKLTQEGESSTDEGYDVSEEPPAPPATHGSAPVDFDSEPEETNEPENIPVIRPQRKLNWRKLWPLLVPLFAGGGFGARNMMPQENPAAHPVSEVVRRVDEAVPSGAASRAVRPVVPKANANAPVQQPAQTPQVQPDGTLNNNSGYYQRMFDTHD